MMYNSPVDESWNALWMIQLYYISLDAQTVSGTRNCPNSLVALFQSGNIPHRLRSPRIYIYSRILNVK